MNDISKVYVYGQPPELEVLPIRTFDTRASALSFISGQDWGMYWISEYSFRAEQWQFTQIPVISDWNL